uniref:Uncharacterized protein n=1 Tax=Glossina pallidipes TaxID=7398 RepID=A0A1B0A1Z9_GLOPL
MAKKISMGLLGNNGVPPSIIIGDSRLSSSLKSKGSKAAASAFHWKFCTTFSLGFLMSNACSGLIACDNLMVGNMVIQPFSSNNPPKFNCDLLSPEVEVKAIAGPMSKEQTIFPSPRIGSIITLPIGSIITLPNNFFTSPMKSRPVNSTPCKTPKESMSESLGSPTVSLKGRSLFNVH